MTSFGRKLNLFQANVQFICPLELLAYQRSLKWNIDPKWINTLTTNISNDCRANQLTGFYMIGNINELKSNQNQKVLLNFSCGFKFLKRIV